MTAVSAVGVSFAKFCFLRLTILCLLSLSLIQIMPLSFCYLLYYTVFQWRVRSTVGETTENLNCFFGAEFTDYIGHLNFVFVYSNIQKMYQSCTYYHLPQIRTPGPAN